MKNSLIERIQHYFFYFPSLLLSVPLCSLLSFLLRALLRFPVPLCSLLSFPFLYEFNQTILSFFAFSFSVNSTKPLNYLCFNLLHFLPPLPRLLRLKLLLQQSSLPNRFKHSCLCCSQLCLPSSASSHHCNNVPIFILLSAFSLLPPPLCFHPHPHSNKQIPKPTDPSAFILNSLKQQQEEDLLQTLQKRRRSGRTTAQARPELASAHLPPLCLPLRFSPRIRLVRGRAGLVRGRVGVGRDEAAIRRFGVGREKPRKGMQKQEKKNEMKAARK